MRVLARAAASVARAYDWLLQSDTHRFRLVVLLMFAGAAWLLAGGLDRVADLRERAHWARLNSLATTPVPYRAHLPRLREALAPVLPESGAGLYAVVRTDELGTSQERAGFCGGIGREKARAAVLRATGIPVLLVTLESARVSECSGEDLARATHRAGSGSAGGDDELRAEFAGARWLLVDREFRVVYNRQQIPAVRQLADLARLLSESTPGGDSSR